MLFKIFCHLGGGGLVQCLGLSGWTWPSRFDYVSLLLLHKPLTFVQFGISSWLSRADMLKSRLIPFFLLQRSRSFVQRCQYSMEISQTDSFSIYFLEPMSSKCYWDNECRPTANQTFRENRWWCFFYFLLFIFSFSKKKMSDRTAQVFIHCRVPLGRGITFFFSQESISKSEAYLSRWYADSYTQKLQAFVTVALMVIPHMVPSHLHDNTVKPHILMMSHTPLHHAWLWLSSFAFAGQFRTTDSSHLSFIVTSLKDHYEHQHQGFMATLYPSSVFIKAFCLNLTCLRCGCQ